jgi:hypothetical protein
MLLDPVPMADLTSILKNPNNINIINNFDDGNMIFSLNINLILHFVKSFVKCKQIFTFYIPANFFILNTKKNIKLPLAPIDKITKSVELTNMDESVITYVAGFCSRSLSKLSSCKDCQDFLKNDGESSVWIDRKQFDGCSLFKPWLKCY